VDDEASIDVPSPEPQPERRSERLRWKIAVRESDLPSTQRLAAYAFDTFANADGRAFPSTAALAAATGLSRRSILRALVALESKGWLVRIGEVRAKRGGSSIPIRQTAKPSSSLTSSVIRVPC